MKKAVIFFIFIVFFWNSVFAQGKKTLQAPAKPPAQNTLNGLSSDFQSAIKKITPSLAKIRISKLHVEPGMPEHYDIAGIGTGIVVSANGYILTNFHVIAESDYTEASIAGEKYLPIKVVGVDILKDLALVKTDLVLSKPLVPAIFEKQNKTSVGTVVLKAGFPDIKTSTNTPIFTHGVVSHTRAFMGDLPAPFGITDAYISPGDSGGPLFNLNGQVVGVNNAVQDRTGYFIPARTVLSVLPRLYKGDVKTGWLGILPADCVDINEARKDDALMSRLLDFLAPRNLSIPMAINDGVLVAEIDKGLEKSSLLKIGDIVTHINNKKPQDKWEFIQWLSEVEPGTAVNLDIIRNGRPMRIQINVEEFLWTASQTTPEDKHSMSIQ